MEISFVALQHLAKISQGGNLSRLREGEGEPFTVIQARNISGLGFDGELTRERLDPEKVKNFRLKEHQVLIGQFASNPKAAVVSSHEVGYVASFNLAVLTLDLNHVDPYYLAGMLSTRAVVRYLQREAGGATAVTIPFKSLRPFRVPLPPLHLQRKVSGAFKRVEDARKASRVLLDAQTDRMEHVALDLWAAAEGADRG